MACLLLQFLNPYINWPVIYCELCIRYMYKASTFHPERQYFQFNQICIAMISYLEIL